MAYHSNPRETYSLPPILGDVVSNSFQMSRCAIGDQPDTAAKSSKTANNTMIINEFSRAGRVSKTWARQPGHGSLALYSPGFTFPMPHAKWLDETLVRLFIE